VRKEKRRRIAMERSFKKSLLKEEEARRKSMEKKWYKSGTFWGSVATAATGIGKAVIAIGAGDPQGIGTGIAIVIGAWTAWRLRKGQASEIV